MFRNATNVNMDVENQREKPQYVACKDVPNPRERMLKISEKSHKNLRLLWCSVTRNIVMNFPITYCKELFSLQHVHFFWGGGFGLLGPSFRV
jgi:hypothetical protein